MGYFKVGYEKMVTIAESSNNFQMHHYQQIAKSKTNTKSGLYFKMSEDHLEILQTKVRTHTENLGKTPTLGWQRTIPEGSNQMLRFYLRR